MRIVFLGPPGAGKGTQATKIVDKFQIPHISTGDIMRAAIKNGTPLGLEVKGYMDKGNLVPDALVISIIGERLGLDDCKTGYLLDGFPRTIEQAKALDEFLNQKGSPLTHVIELVVPEDVLIKRLEERGQGRADDSPEVIKNRLKVYKEQTAPVTQYYGVRVSKIDGVGTVDEILERIVAALKTLKTRKH